MEEPRLEMLAQLHNIRQKRDVSAIGKTLNSYVRRAHEGTSVPKATYGGFAHSRLDRDALNECVGLWVLKNSVQAGGF